MQKLDRATFAGGCFWCTEAIFQRIKGVKSVTPGYTGGKIPNPSYEDVCSGMTGHAESIEIIFDPETISYEELLGIFWQSHDPTTVNRQGSDVGTQYRAAIFYHNDDQRKIAEKSKFALQRQLGKLVVTEIKPAGEFYKAEKSHQNYYNNNKSEGYCRIVISPKLKKLKLE